MASWVRMVAVVLLVAGACAPNRHAGEDRREDDLEALRVENQRLEEENRLLKEVTADLQKLVDEQKFELGAYHGRAGGGLGPLAGPPPGIVLSVKATDVGTFVAISVGSKDGVRLGDEYHLSRGGSYVGKIDIIRVSKDSAIGRFDERFAGPSAPPQVDDKAWVD